MSALLFAGVHKKFGPKVALAGLDLDVPQGSLFGLIGPNGAGKTTAFSIACGFLGADAGGVSVLGGGPFDPARLKGRMTAMPQDASLGPETSCRDHLVFFGRLQGLDALGAERESDRVLEAVGLSDRARARTKTLSHGMLRRLAVAQAFLGSPALILLDEPTSGLDPRHAHDLREMFRRSRQAGQTVIVSSHNLAELEQLCDHVAFIDNGMLVQSGSTAQITGQAAEIEIRLGAGPVPVEALRQALPTATIAHDPEEKRLRIQFPASPGTEAEEVIGIALRVLLDGGARIAGVRKGASLEQKFLEMT